MDDINTYVILEGWEAIGEVAEGDSEPIYYIDVESSELNRNENQDSEQPDLEHFNGEDFLCDQCEYRTPAWKSFRSHFKTQHSGILYKCNMCSYSNKNASSLRMHKKTKHGGTLIRCNMCDYQAGQNADMERHKLAKHLNGVFTCSQCSYTASQPALLRSHVRLKHGDGPALRCQDCDFSTCYPAALRRHRLKHGGSEPLKCLLCDYETMRSDNLKNHVASRHTNIRHPCKECNFLGASASSLNNHVKAIHQQIRFPCEQCGYQARRRALLIAHVRSVHRGRPVGETGSALPCKIRRPLSAYLHFCTAERPNLEPWLNKQESRQELRRRYAQLSPDEKEIFVTKAKLNRQLYMKQLQESQNVGTSTTAEDPNLVPVPTPTDSQNQAVETVTKANAESNTATVVRPQYNAPIETQQLISSIAPSGSSKQLIVSQSPSVSAGICSAPSDSGTKLAPMQTINSRAKLELSISGRSRGGAKLTQLVSDSASVLSCSETNQLISSSTSASSGSNTTSASSGGGLKRFACDQCDYRARLPHHLKGHKRTHHDNIWYRCDQCSYEAKRTDVLKRHVRAVHEQLRYSCDSCDHLATDLSGLYKHRRAQHEKVLVPCPHCHMTFKHKSTQQRHIRDVHLGIRYQCEQCSYMAKQLEHIHAHVRNKHSAKAEEETSAVNAENPNVKKKSAETVKKAKKPTSPFILYCMDKRTALLLEQPHLTTPEVGRELGRQWKALDSATIQHYKDEHARLRMEMLGTLTGKELDKRKAAESNKRKPFRPFFLFMAKERETVRAECPELSIREQAQELARRWKNLRREERERYLLLNRVAWREYKLQEVNRWRAEQQLPLLQLPAHLKSISGDGDLSTGKEDLNAENRNAGTRDLNAGEGECNARNGDLNAGKGDLNAGKRDLDAGNKDLTTENIDSYTLNGNLDLGSREPYFKIVVTNKDDITKTADSGDTDTCLLYDGNIVSDDDCDDSEELVMETVGPSIDTTEVSIGLDEEVEEEEDDDDDIEKDLSGSDEEEDNERVEENATMAEMFLQDKIGSYENLHSEKLLDEKVATIPLGPDSREEEEDIPVATGSGFNGSEKLQTAELTHREKFLFVKEEQLTIHEEHMAEEANTGELKETSVTRELANSEQPRHCPLSSFARARQMIQMPKL